MWVIRASGAITIQVTRHAAFARRENILDRCACVDHAITVAPMWVSVNRVMRLMSDSCVRDAGAGFTRGGLPCNPPDELLICWGTARDTRSKPSSVWGLGG